MNLDGREHMFFLHDQYCSFLSLKYVHCNSVYFTRVFILLETFSDMKTIEGKVAALQLFTHEIVIFIQALQFKMIL